MNALKKKIFTHEINDLGRDWGDTDALNRINDRVDDAIENINATQELGTGYAEENPEMIAGFVLAVTIDYNTNLLIKTIQEGFTAIVEELRKGSFGEEMKRERASSERIAAAKEA